MNAQDPWQQLPVAAHPAMLARGGDVVARGKFLDHFDVGGEAGARENAFEQVVAEHRAVRKAAVERGVHRLHVQEALAGEGAGAPGAAQEP